MARSTASLDTLPPELKRRILDFLAEEPYEIERPALRAIATIDAHFAELAAPKGWRVIHPLRADGTVDEACMHLLSTFYGHVRRIDFEDYIDDRTEATGDLRKAIKATMKRIGRWRSTDFDRLRHLVIASVHSDNLAAALAALSRFGRLPPVLDLRGSRTRRFEIRSELLLKHISPLGAHIVILDLYSFVVNDHLTKPSSAYDSNVHRIGAVSPFLTFLSTLPRLAVLRLDEIELPGRAYVSSWSLPALRHLLVRRVHEELYSSSQWLRQILKGSPSLQTLAIGEPYEQSRPAGVHPSDPISFHLPDLPRPQPFPPTLSILGCHAKPDVLGHGTFAGVVELHWDCPEIGKQAIEDFNDIVDSWSEPEVFPDLKRFVFRFSGGGVDERRIEAHIRRRVHEPKGVFRQRGVEFCELTPAMKAIETGDLRHLYPLVGISLDQHETSQCCG